MKPASRRLRNAARTVTREAPYRVRSLASVGSLCPGGTTHADAEYQREQTWQEVGGKWEARDAVDNRAAPVAARVRPWVRPARAMLRGEVRASSLLAKWVPSHHRAHKRSHHKGL